MPIDDPLAEDHMRQRLEILEAMSTVIDRRNELMHVVSTAANGEAAQHAVMDHFKFTSVQAMAALDLQVRRFAGEQRRRIRDEADQIRHDLSAD